MKRLIPFVMLLVMIPAVLADLLPPPPSVVLGGALLLLVSNYIINMIIILVQSKIWLMLEFKKIATGLAIITPIMFVVEYLLTSTFRGILFDYYGFKIGLISFVVIYFSYFLLSTYFWKLDPKKSIITSLVMGLLTNPGVYIFFYYLFFN
jgi:hypothetical protein